MRKVFDAIVVGAGPAGSAAALTLAKQGAQVLCLERGEFPGAKNISGGILYGNLLADLVPSTKTQYPLERRIVRHVIEIASKGHLLSLHSQSQKEESVNYGHSILRKRFDLWLAQQAIREGAKLLTEVTVDDVIWKNGKAVGVKARRQQGGIFAGLIILADGVNSILANKSGLRNAFRPHQMILAVKEIIRLPEQLIETRFNIRNGEGAAYSMIGDVTAGIEGGCFLYTNRRSLSLGIACHLNSLIREKVRIQDLLERFKKKGNIFRLLEGGVLKEYSAHLIPNLGAKEQSRMVANGIIVVGDAAGLTLNNGFLVRGMDFALASGIAAAETGLEALEKGDFSEKALLGYKERLKAGFVLKDLKTFKRAKRTLSERNLYSLYPSIVGGLFSEIFAVSGEPKKKAIHLLFEQLHKQKTAYKFIADSIRIIRSI